MMDDIITRVQFSQSGRATVYTTNGTLGVFTGVEAEALYGGVTETLKYIEAKRADAKKGIESKAAE